MKNILLLTIICASISFVATAQTKADKKDTVLHTAFYSCPMHPDQKMNKAGRCPVCGMNMVLNGKEQMKREVTHTYSCPAHADAVSNHSGKCPRCNSKLVADRKASKQSSLVYTCGMHPDVASEKPGKCPVCGMALVEKKVVTQNND